MRPLISLLAAAFTVWLSVATAAPSPCPSDRSLLGYSNWYTLEADVQTGTRTNYIICPGSTFDLSDSSAPGWDAEHFIYVQGPDSPLTIQCGADGKRENNCVVKGGVHHLEFGEGARDVLVKGLTFQDATEGSIMVYCALEYSKCEVEATFEDCLWSGNKNTASSCDGYSGCAAAVNNYKGALIFRQCDFLQNSAYLGAINSRYGSIELDQCRFEKNKSTWKQLNYGNTYSEATGSALTTWDTMTSIKDSCFIKNNAQGPSTVKINQANLVANERNYFSSNTVGTPVKGNTPPCQALIEQGTSRIDWKDNKCIEASGTTCDTGNTKNECSDTGICSDHGSCSDHANGYTCSCDDGWGGENCIIDLVDGCNPDPCNGHGSCTDLADGYRCSCSDGWGGEDCNIDLVDGCASNVCGDHGTCKDQDIGYKCICDDGWGGDNCDVDVVDGCLSNPCRGHGRCIDLVDGYSCSCFDGWDGDNCENDPCGNHGTCMDEEVGYTCTCDADWTGTNCGKKLDQTANFVIEWIGVGSPRNGGWGACTDPEPHLSAECTGGYISIPEWSSDKHECVVVASNRKKISCKSQQSGTVGVSCRGTNPSAVDLMVDLSSSSAFCDGFANTGWGGTAMQAITLQTFCDGQWAFHSDTCSEKASKLNGNPYCYSESDCFRAFYDDKCYTQVPSIRVESVGAAACNKVDSCDPDPCENGQCTASSDGYTCNCNEGWSGVNCDVSPTPSRCEPSPCVHGDCIENENEFECNCEDGWIGNLCEDPIIIEGEDSCDPDPCKNGDCVETQDGIACLCHEGWFGSVCQTKQTFENVSGTHTIWPEWIGTIASVGLAIHLMLL